MSFILDALKKSQPHSGQHVPTAMSSQQSYQHQSASETRFNWWPLAIILLIALSASVGYLLARIQPFSPNTQVIEPQSNAESRGEQHQQGVSVSQPNVVIKQTERPNKEPVLNDTNNASNTSQLAKNFTNPDQANRFTRPEKVVVPEPQGTPITPKAHIQAEEKVEVPDDLLKRFNQALEEVAENQGPTEISQLDKLEEYSNIPLAAEMPVRVQRALPTMIFSQHMYASEPRERWVKVNDTQLYEGQWLDDNVQLLHIQPRFVVMAYQGQEFRLPALTDW